MVVIDVDNCLDNFLKEHDLTKNEFEILLEQKLNEKIETVSCFMDDVFLINMRIVEIDVNTDESIFSCSRITFEEMADYIKENK